MARVSDHEAQRLALAGPDTFANANAGPVRRERLAGMAHEFLTQSWQSALENTGFANEAQRGLGVALAVVGSQARGDAGPLSDYDIVLIHEGRAKASKNIDKIADALWYPLWDAGVRFDHSVRTVSDCRKVAGGDLAALVGLLDIRGVAGDVELVTQVREGIGADWRGAARKRLPELIESLRERHERFGDLTTSLEPDLKEAGGGLRDVSLIAALIQSWLADPNRRLLAPAQQKLLDVRDAIHVVTGRGRERLFLQDQDAVAELLGYGDADELLTDVVDAGRTISFVLDASIRSASQSQRARTLRVGPRKPVLKSLGFGLSLHDDEVVLSSGRSPHGMICRVSLCHPMLL